MDPLKDNYDSNLICRCCKLPALKVSMGGTDLCPWCDMGVFRDGTNWTFRDCIDDEYRIKRAKEAIEVWVSYFCKHISLSDEQCR
jgi:hypothetical protein